MSLRETSAATNPLLQLVELTRRARLAGSQAELAFLVVNDSRALGVYRQAALWFAESGVNALSGVVEPEANAPYVQWLERLFCLLAKKHDLPTPVDAIQLPSDLAEEWIEWLPAHALWLPFSGTPEQGGRGGLLLAGEHPWEAPMVALFGEWIGTWHLTWAARTPPRIWSWPHFKQAIRTSVAKQPGKPLWKQRRLRIATAVSSILLFPVHLSVLAPGELVPANPSVIRAPIDGVVGQFQVQPNESVKMGQFLFNFDEAVIATRHEVAVQALATAEAEYRQYAQQAVADPKAKAQLAPLLGKIEEKRAEADFSKDILERSRITAPQDGIVLFDDPSEWIGKPVQTGERIMRIAAPGDIEVEAWLPIGDAIPLPEHAALNLYLSANPLSSLSAKVRYVAHDATPRPDGTYAYRIRATLDTSTSQRVGLKGTARLRGGWVPLGYWVFRRPLAIIRQTVGL